MKLENLRPSEVVLVAQAAETMLALWNARAKTDDARATDEVTVTPEHWWQDRGSDGTGRNVLKEVCNRINPKLKGWSVAELQTDRDETARESRKGGTNPWGEEDHWHGRDGPGTG